MSFLLLECSSHSDSYYFESVFQAALDYVMRGRVYGVGLPGAAKPACGCNSGMRACIRWFRGGPYYTRTVTGAGVHPIVDDES